MAPPKPAGEGDGNTPIAPPSSGQPGSPASVEDPRTSVRRLSTRLHSLSAQLQDATATREGVRTEHGETRRDLRDPTGIQPADQIRILRQQLHGQAMEIQGWGHTTDSRDRDLRRQLADEARQIYDLESRLDHVFLQRDHLRQSNDHLFQEMRLAGSEIDGLHTRIWDQERELADAVAANMASEESLQRLQEELRLTQEEVVTNAYVGSIHGGSTHGSTCGGLPPLIRTPLRRIKHRGIWPKRNRKSPGFRTTCESPVSPPPD
ncbi:hypothetical protein PI125_g6997 [Phytophthora idaei]|nr:hypothetical protein PI125_g6997 [Phytophthora idaei]KAG3126889.1 hypothetical protein PI126_g22123 [Phytophthora idaei]